MITFRLLCWKGFEWLQSLQAWCIKGIGFRETPPSLSAPLGSGLGEAGWNLWVTSRVLQTLLDRKPGEARLSW